MVTDSPTALNFDPATLGMKSKHKWSDHMVKFGNMGEVDLTLALALHQLAAVWSPHLSASRLIPLRPKLTWA